MREKERYDWYERDVSAFMLSLDLPAYRENMPLNTVVSEEKKTFVTKFSEMLEKNKFRGFSDNFYESLAKTLPEIKDSFEQLTQIIDYYDNADLASAQKAFDVMMERLKEFLFISDIYWPNTKQTFFRVRESPKEKLKEPKDLFHIPYKKRHLVGNERYSLAGHPCLYLSTALPIAWQECGYPHAYYYSEFQFQESEEKEEEWRFITFLSPSEVAQKWFVAMNPPEDVYLAKAKSCFLTYPLVFACSIVNPNGNSAFKPEYVIPQMLTQWVYRQYDFVKGIKYFPCYESEKIPCYSGYNVVLPVKNIDLRRGLSKDLVAKFRGSKPIYIENGFKDSQVEIVKRFKSDLLNIKRDTFFEASNCLLEFYIQTNLLEKIIKNTNATDMQLVLSAIRSVVKNGTRILEKYRKEDLLNQGRTSNTYSESIEKKLEAFANIHDRFKSDVVEIAKSYSDLIDYMPSHSVDEFVPI